MTTLSFHITQRGSIQTKLGKMLRTTSGKHTCWKGCPFLDNGCYADNAPMSWHWNKVTSGARGTSYERFIGGLSYLLRDNELWRHNEAGELVNSHGKIDKAALMRLCRGTMHARGFTYTHLPLTGDNVSILRDVQFMHGNSFQVNISCESERKADLAIRKGLRAVMVTNKKDRRTWETREGNTVVMCPAQVATKKVTCDKCQLCFQRRDNVIIGFHAHGDKSNQVEEIVSVRAKQTISATESPFQSSGESVL